MKPYSLDVRVLAYCDAGMRIRAVARNETVNES